MPSSNHTQVFSLLKLPQELRDKIYRFLLVSEFPLGVPRFIAGPQLCIDTEILRTSSQIYAETHAILLNENMFLCQQDPFGPGDVARESALRLARHLKVDYGVKNACNNVAEDSLLNFLSTRPPLRSLHINIRCYTTHPLQWYSEMVDKHFSSIRILEKITATITYKRNYRIYWRRRPWSEQDARHEAEFWKRFEDTKRKMLLRADQDRVQRSSPSTLCPGQIRERKF